MPSQPGTTAAVEDEVGIIGGCPTGLVAAIAAGTQRVNTVPAELRATTHTHTAGPRRAPQNRALAGGAAPLAVADLVGALGDDGGDAPVAQGVAAGVGRSRPCRRGPAVGVVRGRPASGQGTRSSPSSGRVGESPAWPGVQIRTSGRPAPSMRARALVLSPPRERPTA